MPNISIESPKPISVYSLYGLNMLNGIGIAAAQVVLSLYALALGASHFAVGVVAAMFSICPMLLAVVAGKLIDRVGCRWPMTLGAACGGLGMLALYLVPGLPAIYVAGMMSGISMLAFGLSTQNLVGLLSTPETRARNFSNYALSSSVSSFLWPLIGGFLIDHLDFAVTCLCLAILALMPVTLLLTRGSGLPQGTRQVMKAGGGIRETLSDPMVRQLLITGSLVNAGLNLFQFYMPVYAHSVGLSASVIGTLLATSAIAQVIVRFGLPQLLARFGQGQLLAYAFYIGAASLLMIPLFHNAALLMLVSFVFGLGMCYGQPIVIMMMFSNSQKGRSGETLGLKITTNHITKSISPMVFGAIASAFGLLSMFWFSAIMMAVGGMISRARTAGN